MTTLEILLRETLHEKRARAGSMGGRANVRMHPHTREYMSALGTRGGRPRLLTIQEILNGGHIMTTSEIELKQRVLSILERHYGHRNAIKGKDLAQLCNLNDDRAVQLAILELTESGTPVCSACDRPMGYYLPETRDEAAAYFQQITNRAIENFNRRKKFKKAFQQWFYGQPQRKLL